MELTKEQEITRYEELKKIGYQKLQGAEREEYSNLKKKYADELKDEGDDEENITKKPRKVEVTEVYEMNTNVLHNGKTFNKGDRLNADDPLVEEFKIKGFVTQLFLK